MRWRGRMPHIDEGRLHEWLDRSRSGMTRADAAEVAHHLETCAECRAKAAEASGLRDRSGDILAGAGPISITQPPFEAVQARVGAETTEPRSAPRNFVALAWAASIMAALGLGWLSRELIRPEQIAFERAAVEMESGGDIVERESAAVGLDSAASGGPTALSAPDPRIPSTSLDAADERAEPAPTAGDARPPYLPTVSPGDMPGPPAATDADGSGVPRVAAADAAATRQNVPLLVHGRVTDDEGRPVAGVVVEIIEVRTAVLTDQQGNYSLAVPTGTSPADRALTLDASGTGFGAERVTLAGEGADSVSADFRLQSLALALDEPVADAAAAPPQIERSAARATLAPTPPPDEPTPHVSIPPAAPDVWVSTARADAERRFGRPLLTIVDLPIVRVEFREDGTGVAVRVVHVQEGAELSLTQTPLTGPVADPPLPPEGFRRLTEQRGDLRLSVTGPLPSDSLATLLRRVR
ncbi:MAG: hypothetical protein GEU90_03090 [Gemmatimonas sp.]|nr:hypothetical protein [Gemmatimonas sp.]